MFPSSASTIAAAARPKPPPARAGASWTAAGGGGAGAPDAAAAGAAFGTRSSTSPHRLQNRSVDRWGLAQRGQRRSKPFPPASVPVLCPPSTAKPPSRADASRSPRESPAGWRSLRRAAGDADVRDLVLVAAVAELDDPGAAVALVRDLGVVLLDLVERHVEAGLLDLLLPLAVGLLEVRLPVADHDARGAFLRRLRDHELAGLREVLRELRVAAEGVRAAVDGRAF